MKKNLLLLVLLVSTQLVSAEGVLQNVYARQTQSLNGSWNYIIDPFDNGYYDYRLQPSSNGFFKNQKAKDKLDLVEYDFDRSPLMVLPTDWNTQRPELFFYEGTVWFKKDFTWHRQAGTRTHIYLGAANYESKVYVNGQLAGVHEGGFTPFHFDVTDKLVEGSNFVVVKVNNHRKGPSVPTVNADWWNYGGITRDIMLVHTPELYVDDYRIQLSKGSYQRIEGQVKLNKAQAGEEVTLHLPELKIAQTLRTDSEGVASFEIKARPELWSPQSPRLYELKLTLRGETLIDHVGFRQIEAVGKEVRLNGQKVFLKGISIHEEAPFRQGRAWSAEDARVLLGWAKELGCNFVRLAHYPHNEHMVRMAEEMGLMVWSEIPVYWTIHWDNAETYRNAQQQLSDMIARDKNRCAVVVWSVANETPHGESRDKFLTRLVEHAREMDQTRLISMAMEVTGLPDNVNRVDDYMSQYVDIISFNHYLGWYGGKIADCQLKKWEIAYNKPIFVSEFGAGALQGLHGGADERWTEEYQAELYKETLAMYNKIDGFAGCSPWILVDFYSPRRQLPGIQDYFNRKGLISNHGIKKKAFFVLEEFYGEK